MKDSIFHKLIKKIKTKKFGYPSVSEYAFSPEEIANLNEQNKQKIQDLKQDLNIKVINFLCRLQVKVRLYFFKSKLCCGLFNFFLKYDRYFFRIRSFLDAFDFHLILK